MRDGKPFSRANYNVTYEGTIALIDKINKCDHHRNKLEAALRNWAAIGMYAFVCALPSLSDYQNRQKLNGETKTVDVGCEFDVDLD